MVISRDGNGGTRSEEEMEEEKEEDTQTMQVLGEWLIMMSELML